MREKKWFYSLREKVDSLGRIWNSFWFDQRFDGRLVLFRRLFALVFFFFLLSKTPDLEVFYCQVEGFANNQVFESFTNQGIRFLPPDGLRSIVVVGIAHFVLLTMMLAMVFFNPKRWVYLLAWFLQVTFINMNPSVSFGVDSIGVFSLLYLAISSGGTNQKWGGVSRRLLQIQICLIYAFAGIDKLKSVYWWSGDALWYVFHNSQVMRVEIPGLDFFPGALSFATYFVLAWEVYFPILVWVDQTRRLVLFFGILLHLGIATLMILPSFGLLMITTYVLFLTDNELVRLMGFLPPCSENFLK